MRCALLRDADAAERPRSAGSSTTATRSSCTRTSASCPRRRGCVGVVERGPGGVRSARIGRHHDLPHEPAPVAAGTDPVLRVDQPGRPRARRARHPRPASSATRCTRSGRSRPRLRSGASRATAPPGTRAPTWATASTRTAAGPGYEAAGLVGAAALGPRGPGSVPHEVAPARGQGPAPSGPPVAYALEHDVFYFALDLVGAGRGCSLAPPGQPQPPERPPVPGRRPLAGAGRGPPRDGPRPPARRGRGSRGLADHAGHQPAGAGLRVQPGQLLPVP